MAGRLGREVYRLPRWRATRRAVLERDAWTCQACGGPGTEVHHIAKLQDGGAPFDLGNLRTLCRSCHLATHMPARVKVWRNVLERAFSRSA